MLTFPNELLRDPDFVKWVSSSEGRVWMTLWGSVSREQHQDVEVYNNFYKNKKLATRMSILKLNKALGYSSNDKSNVSKIINKLTNKNFIKKHSMGNKDPNIYEVGYVENNKNIEIPYAIELFSIKKSEKSIKSVLCKYHDYSEQKQ